jgi:hypothetical protein
MQRAADMAAMSATWTYWNRNYAFTQNYSSDVTGGMSAATARVNQVLTANGVPATAGVTVCFVDYQARVFTANSCAGSLGAPGVADIRGVQVTVSQAVGPQVSGTGLAAFTVGAQATAVLGPPAGATRMAPLLLQNYATSTNALPRANAYGGGAGQCPQTMATGVRYPAVPDCRPGVTAAGTPQAVNLIPAYEGTPASKPAAPPFATAPWVEFYIVHDDPQTCTTGGYYSTCAATSNTIRLGEGTTDIDETAGMESGSDIISTCPATGACTSYYVEMRRQGTPFVDDAVWSSMNARIGAAGGANFLAQDCSDPRNPLHPLTPDNPRLMRLPVNYAAAPTDVSNSNVATVNVSETVLFCVQYDTVTAQLPAKNGGTGAYVVTGYLVNEPTNDPTLAMRATDNAYFGQDVVVRLTQ